jgi:hypothetical protein
LTAGDEDSLILNCFDKIEKYNLRWDNDWDYISQQLPDDSSVESNDSIDSITSVTGKHLLALRCHEISVFQWKNLNIYAPEWYYDMDGYLRRFALHHHLDWQKRLTFSQEIRVVDWSCVDSFQEGIELRYGPRDAFNTNHFKVGPPKDWVCLTVRLAKRITDAQIESLDTQITYLQMHQQVRYQMTKPKRRVSLNSRKYAPAGGGIMILRPTANLETAFQHYCSTIDSRSTIMKMNRQAIRANKERIVENRNQETQLHNAVIEDWMRDETRETITGVEEDVFWQEDAIMTDITNSYYQQTTAQEKKKDRFPRVPSYIPGYEDWKYTRLDDDSSVGSLE